MTRHRKTAAVLGLAMIGMLQNQAYAQTRDAFWKNLNNSCVETTGAPPGSVLAKKYCECSADEVMAQFSFDERMRMAVQMEDGTTPAATKEKLTGIAKVCMRRATAP